MSVHLTPDQQAMCDGKRGPVLEFAMGLLVAAGDMQGAPRLQKIDAAYVNTTFSGAPSHLDFMEWVAGEGVQVAVPTHTNIGGWDARNPDLRVGPDIAEANTEARRLIELHRDVGCHLSMTCAPYQLPSTPEFGSHVACSESNAVSYFNSVAGVRTAKYGDYLDMAAGLTGLVPATGLHLDAPRTGTLIFDIPHLPRPTRRDDLTYQLIGYVIGRKAGKDVPVITGLSLDATPRNLRSICAAANASGVVPMYHAIGLTPEAPDIETATRGNDRPRVQITVQDLASAREDLSGFAGGKIDAVAIGTPHASLDEMEETVGWLQDRRIAPDVTFYIQANRFVFEAAKEKGWIATLERAGVTIVTDTCLYWRPATRGLTGRIMTTSGKFAYYAPAELDASCRIATLRECVESAVRGEVWRDPGLEGLA